MQIVKINENQLEIILNVQDLHKKNISLHSFMCNSKESNSFFLEILNFIDKELNFRIKNYELSIEAFAVTSKASFVIVITRIPKKAYLRPSRKFTGNFSFKKSFWIKFNTLENFCRFCNFINKNSNIRTSLFLLNNYYFLHISTTNIKSYFRILNNAYEFSDYIYNQDFILNENAKTIIKDCAIQTAIKYFT